MILSGAKGKLLKIDTEAKTVTVHKHTGVQDFGYDKNFDAEKYTPLVGSIVNIELCDFMVIGITKE
ncbi:MAG: hypothetical protein QXJ74_10520 [Nitrososphaera sp.]|uniref:hypothetical protein n=1 Tax=Nitrososphaera sp. TaxID=1971748 RepID=UPI0017C6AD7F|nr:hypothetical protein [Nitrososphaera sp.]NWG37879.1 hypothetical protein [Nitrososphaera sp.]